MTTNSALEVEVIFLVLLMADCNKIGFGESTIMISIERGKGKRGVERKKGKIINISSFKIIKQCSSLFHIYQNLMKCFKNSKTLIVTKLSL